MQRYAIIITNFEIIKILKFKPKNMASIDKTTFTFLKNLTKNNNREWFNERKDLYISAKENVQHLVENLIEEIAIFDEKIAMIDAKKSLFRIYRDTRFSKLKIPYKTNFGAALGMGKGKEVSGYYLHIEPGRSFIAGGVYMPEASILKQIRTEISKNGEEFLKIINNRNFKKYFGELSKENTLQRIPKGFEKDDPMAEFLKLKSFVVSYPLKDEDLMNENVAKNLAKIYKEMMALNGFIENALNGKL